jgi:hypothetical protein
MNSTKQPLLTTAAAARRLGVSAQSLTNQRYRGSGPPFTQLGPKIVRYDPELLERWITSRTFAETPPRKAARRKTRPAQGAAPTATERDLLPGDGGAKKKAPAAALRQGLLSSCTGPAPASNLKPSSVALATPPR